MTNSVNFYEFIGFVTFNITVLGCTSCILAFFLVVFLCPWYRVRPCIY